MDSRGCLGVLWDHKHGTFDKLYHTSQKFHFKSKKEAIENLWENGQKYYFQPQNCHFFILRRYLELKGDKNEIQFFTGDF